MEIVLVVAWMLVIGILAASAACWTLAALKVIAVSRAVPTGLAEAARQILNAVQVKPGLPLVDWTARRAVPWGLVDLLGMIALYGVALVVMSFSLHALDLMPKELDESKLSLTDKNVMVWGNIIMSVGLLVVALPLIALRTGASTGDFGLSLRRLGSDLQLGLIGFVMLAPPVYAIQGILVTIWKPSKHPIMEMFKTSPDVGFFAVLMLAAAVVAPLFEELVFRVILQGFLEKLFSFRGSALELLVGRTTANLAEPVVAMSAQTGPAEILYVADVRPGFVDPYVPPPIIQEPIVQAELAQSPGTTDALRGFTFWLPIAITSAIFALLHYSHGPDWVALLLLAAGMGYLYQRTHSVVPGLVVHVLLNSLSMLGLWLQVYALPQQGVGP